MIVLASVLGHVAVACTGDSLTTHKSAFRLYVLGPECQWPRLGGYTAEDFWPQLQRCALEESPFVLESRDIETYDWRSHELLLTQDASERFLAMRSSVESDLSVDEFLEHVDLTGTAFVVFVGGEFQYAGVFYEPGGAARIEFPVSHLEERGRQVLLRLRNCQGTDYGTNCIQDYVGALPVKAALEAAGKLRDEQ